VNREQWLSNVEMRGCEAVPCSIHCSAATWHEHREALAEIAARYPDVECNVPSDWDSFAPKQTRGVGFRDAWGCLWQNLHDGMTGQVFDHPLADWDAFGDFQAPDPASTGHMQALDWAAEGRAIRAAREQGALTAGALDHGFFFQRLCYLRGFNALMLDIATGEPMLDELCAMVAEFNLGLVRRCLELGVDVMHFGDDLGMQDRLPISPAAWRRYIRPTYERLFGLCRRAGAHVYMHSDGYIVDVMADLIDCGVTILNPQDLCNGLENIRRELKGKVCIELDIDRQTIIPRGTPGQIDEHIARCVRMLASPAGGLSLKCGVYPGTPLRNIEALFKAMTRHRRPFA